MKFLFVLLYLLFLAVETSQAIEGELTIGDILQDSQGNLEIQVFWDGDINKYYNETRDGEWCLVGYLETSWILRIGETSKMMSYCELRSNQNGTLLFGGIPFEDLPENCTYELEMYYFTYVEIPRLFHERYTLNYYNTYIGSFINSAANFVTFDVLYILLFAVIAAICLLIWRYK